MVVDDVGLSLMVGTENEIENSTTSSLYKIQIKITIILVIVFRPKYPNKSKRLQ